MPEPGLKISVSSLGGCRNGKRAGNCDTLARLQALDKNGDGQLDLGEVCDAIDEIIRKEKTERTLKCLLAALAVFSLLTIAATVGLTYAVVAMSKDTKVDGTVLRGKDTGEVLRTGSFLQSQNSSALHDAIAASDKPGTVLGRIKSIKVPSLKEGEAYTVYKVDSVTMLSNGSALVRTATGLDVLMLGNSTAAGPASTEAPNATEIVQGRKLLANACAGTTKEIFQAYIKNVNTETGYVILPATSTTTIGQLKEMVSKADEPYGLSIESQVLTDGANTYNTMDFQLVDDQLLFAESNTEYVAIYNLFYTKPTTIKYIISESDPQLCIITRHLEMVYYRLRINFYNMATDESKEFYVIVPKWDTVGGLKRALKLDPSTTAVFMHSAAEYLSDFSGQPDEDLFSDYCPDYHPGSDDYCMVQVNLHFEVYS